MTIRPYADDRLDAAGLRSASEASLRTGPPPRLQQIGDEGGPASLVRRAKSLASITVKIFVEQQMAANRPLTHQRGSRPIGGAQK
jgi:hypothetical protein